MPRIVLKCTGNDMPLPPHEQSILNTLVYSVLCREDIFSILNKVNQEQRGDALYIALDWSLTHCLIDDEQD